MGQGVPRTISRISPIKRGADLVRYGRRMP